MWWEKGDYLRAARASPIICKSCLGEMVLTSNGTMLRRVLERGQTAPVIGGAWFRVG